MRIQKLVLQQSLLALSFPSKLSSLGNVLGLGLLPQLNHLLLALLASGLECHLPWVWLDNKKRVGLVEWYFNFLARHRVNLALQIKGPHERAAPCYRFVTSNRHAQTLTLAPPKRGHAHEVRVLGQGCLERRPARLQPTLRSKLFRLGVLDGVAKESIVKRENARALGDKVTLEPVIGLGFVRNTYSSC
jgi:hypothetical protein